MTRKKLMRGWPFCILAPWLKRSCNSHRVSGWQFFKNYLSFQQAHKQALAAKLQTLDKMATTGVSADTIRVQYSHLLKQPEMSPAIWVLKALWGQWIPRNWMLEDVVGVVSGCHSKREAGTHTLTVEILMSVRCYIGSILVSSQWKGFVLMDHSCVSFPSAIFFDHGKAFSQCSMVQILPYRLRECSRKERGWQCPLKERVISPLSSTASWLMWWLGHRGSLALWIDFPRVMGM